MYIENIRYTPNRIAEIWLLENTDIPDDWETKVREWFPVWVEKNQAEVEYAGKKISNESLRDSVKTRIRQVYETEIEKEYEKVCKVKIKGWLKKYF